MLDADEAELRDYLSSLARRADTGADLIGPVRSRVRRARLARVVTASVVAIVACALTAGLARARPAGGDITTAGPTPTAPATSPPACPPPAPVSPADIPAGTFPGGASIDDGGTLWRAQFTTDFGTRLQSGGGPLNILPTTKYLANGAPCTQPKLTVGGWVFVLAAPSATTPGTYDVRAVIFPTAP
jgi:hypothetical protein